MNPLPHRPAHEKADPEDCNTSANPRFVDIVTSGWKWGGDWPGAKDYQHFSSTGG